MYKILVVEDDIAINNLLKEILTKEDYEVVQVFTGADGISRLSENFDLVLLDLMMPILDGETMISKMREGGFKEPIIVISAKIDSETRYRVLEIGADDFITKPFENMDVISRVKANIRRYRDFSAENSKAETVHKNLKYLEAESRFLLLGEDLKLTHIEYEILKTLIKNPNKIFSKENLYCSVWKEEYIYEAATINAHISNLRNKLKKLDDEEYIETIWGMGYRLKK